MSACRHEKFQARVEVARIHEDAEDPESVVHFMAEVTVKCAECDEPFGFRGPPAGHSWTEPRCTPDAVEVRIPMMSPAELKLAGPLPAMRRAPMRYEILP